MRSWQNSLIGVSFLSGELARDRAGWIAGGVDRKAGPGGGSGGGSMNGAGALSRMPAARTPMEPRPARSEAPAPARGTPAARRPGSVAGSPLPASVLPS